MKQLFREADKNGDGTLCLKEVLDVLKQFSVPVSNEKAKQIFRVISFYSCLVDNI